MSKKYDIRKIKAKRSYSFKDISDLLNVHVRTVQSWHVEGLGVLEGSSNPYLVMGYTMKNFLIQKTKNRRTELQDNQFYCMSCREAVIPLEVFKFIGKAKVGGNKPSVRMQGKCPICNSTVNRFTTKESSLVVGEASNKWDLEYPRKHLH